LGVKPRLGKEENIKKKTFAVPGVGICIGATTREHTKHQNEEKKKGSKCGRNEENSRYRARKAPPCLRGGGKKKGLRFRKGKKV